MFKSQHSFEQRLSESSKIRLKYPNRYPIIVERAPESKIQLIDKQKFLVSNELSVAQFIYVIRKRIKIKPEEGIYLFVNNTLPPTSELMVNLYKKNKDDDGFLYVLYAGETVFGS